MWFSAHTLDCASLYTLLPSTLTYILKCLFCRMVARI
jgi:hypothetical protein